MAKPESPGQLKTANQDSRILPPMLIVDAHLDLAYNALRGRDFLRPAADASSDDQGAAAVSLPDLRAGGVALACGTIYCQPDHQRIGQGYRTADEAAAAGRAQLAWYHQHCRDGHLRLVLCAADLPQGDGASPRQSSPPAPLPIIILMEGADPIRDPAEAQWWFDAGVRIVGLAWRATRYAGGTGEAGPLTPQGVELVAAMDRLGIIHDVSHLAEQSFWQLLEQSVGPVMASHSNCRAIIPTDRHLSDQMIRALAARGGVIGVNLFDKFLLPPEQHGSRRATLDDVVRHIEHLASVMGHTRQIGLGSDMDGGFGREHLPRELTTAADLPRLFEHLSARGFSREQVEGMAAGNWLEFFARHLAVSAPRRPTP